EVAERHGYRFGHLLPFGSCVPRYRAARAPVAAGRSAPTLVSVAQHPTSSAPTATSVVPSYTERLRTPWWMWLAGLGLAAFAAAEVYLGAPGRATWVPYLVLIPLTALGLWRLGRIRI